MTGIMVPGLNYDWSLERAYLITDDPTQTHQKVSIFNSIATDWQSLMSSLIINRSDL